MNAKTFTRLVPPLIIVVAALSLQAGIAPRAAVQSGPSIAVPKAWNDRDLSQWATPLAGLGQRPGFYSEAELDAIPVEKLYRAYPTYHPDYEPAGYWDWLQKQPPRPLLDPASLHTEGEWIAAGRSVFHELYRPLPTADLVSIVRSRSALERLGMKALPDGTLPLLWIVTPDGVRPVPKACASCHTRYLPDGTIIDGAPGDHQLLPVPRLRGNLQRFNPEAQRTRLYREYRVPWVKNDIHETITSMPPDDLRELASVEIREDGIMPRFGSAFFPTKTLDLNGVRDRKYLDHTATHLNRGVGDIMRYALNIDCCHAEIYGPFRFDIDPATGKPRLPRFRLPDDVLFALATYIYSLNPPPSPYRNDPHAAEGKRIFEREGCGACHTPPLYTNNKLTLAKGFTPPVDHPYKNDIMPLSVGTDPGRAMQTRVGTGFYRVPSLKGVWYRGLFGHAGDVVTLEGWFDPARLRDDYVPSGWQGIKQTHRAVPGHQFGLKLPSAEKRALIAFLKTL